MKNFKRVLSALCLLAMLFGMAAMAGCSNEPDATTTVPGTTAPSVSGQKTDYVVTVTSKGGLPLADVAIDIYANDKLEDLVAYGSTNADGKATISMKPDTSYRIVLSYVPEGYIAEESYAFTGNAANISLSSQIIEDTDVAGVTYTLGSVMHDIEFTDTDGNVHKLSEVLKEKDMVMLNFWYTTCSYCVEEFPYMESAYQQYSDKIEIFALNPTGESMDTNKNFKESMGLSFPFGDDSGAAVFAAFNGQGCPTSVFIDKNGVVCLIHTGGLPSETPFINAFKHFTAEDYQQTLFNSIEELVPVQKPDVEMPSSEEMGNVFNKGDITVNFAPEAEDEMSWPFVIGQKDGVDCILPSNDGADNSYATLYANITLKAGQAVGFDYLASCESGMDVLYVLIDRKDIYQISGQSDSWKSCYPWVATKDGEYELAFCYLKDESDASGDDTVYLKDLRVVDAKDIDTATYIPRYCATDLKADGFGYETYATIVFNEADGYYHVGTKDGPLLLANLMSASQFSNDSIYAIAVNGDVVLDGVNYYDQLLPYFTMASNSEIGGYCTVDAALAELLKKVTLAVGIEQSENEWLQICSYYDVYGPNAQQLADPVRGLSADNAIPAKLGKDNVVTYNRVIMPRGLLYKFVPQQSGVYRITSFSEYECNGWIFLREHIEERTEYYVYEAGERLWNDPLNVSMVFYMEAGKEYFIDIAYYDVYQTGSFNFEIKRLGSSYDLLTIASPGYFTFYENSTGDVINGGIDVILGSDGYYHEKRTDGTQGSKLYADFKYANAIFSDSLLNMIDKGAFDFTKDESDHIVEGYIASFKTTDYKAEFKALWGDDFDYYWEEYQVEDVLDGVYHGDGENMTELARKYAGKLITSGDLEGCVEVNEELADLLQQLMDKYTFKDVDHAWTKLCYYYKHFG